MEENHTSSALTGQGDLGMTRIVTNSEALIPAGNDKRENIIHGPSLMFLQTDIFLMMNSTLQAKMLINSQLICNNRTSQYVLYAICIWVKNQISTMWDERWEAHYSVEPLTTRRKPLICLLCWQRLLPQCLRCILQCISVWNFKYINSITAIWFSGLVMKCKYLISPQRMGGRIVNVVEPWSSYDLYYLCLNCVW